MEKISDTCLHGFHGQLNMLSPRPPSPMLNARFVASLLSDQFINFGPGAGGLSSDCMGPSVA